MKNHSIKKRKGLIETSTPSVRGSDARKTGGYSGLIYIDDSFWEEPGLLGYISQQNWPKIAWAATLKVICQPWCNARSTEFHVGIQRLYPGNKQVLHDFLLDRLTTNVRPWKSSPTQSLILGCLATISNKPGQNDFLQLYKKQGIICHNLETEFANEDSSGHGVTHEAFALFWVEFMFWRNNYVCT